MNFNSKEKKLLAIILAAWGIVLVGSGFSMNKQLKPIINKKYTLSVSNRQIPKAQAKSKEIKLKEVEVEVNNPISVNVKDYLENPDKLDEKILKSLRLDTSLININEPGEYEYTITYKKKKYIGKVIVKEKELPNVKFSLKHIELNMGSALSTNPRSYINETITDEVYNNLTLDLSQVNNNKAGTYVYYITYKGEKYQGNIKVNAPGPTIKTKTTESCPSDTTLKDGKCVCNDLSTEYDSNTKTCKAKETTSNE